jgi:acyl-CoA synthetase (NDP forming)
MTHAAPPVHPLDAIFRARSVAVVGASANTAKLNGAPIPILRVSGYAGTIYPVNPRYEAIDGLACYRDVESLPQAPDVALVLVPAAEVARVLESCGRKGTHAAVVVSSGFEEVSDSEALVASVRAACDRHGIALVGPNCEGVWSVRNRLLLTFGSAARREALVHAPVAMLSQSGSMAGAVARHLQDSGFGCAYIVSVGNETVLSLLDLMAYMIEQDDVRVLLLFLEGLKDGDRLVALARRARAKGIVVVALKAGSSTAGRAAVASHTGKLTTADAIYRDIFTQAGVLQVASLVELIEAAQVFTSAPLPRVDAGGVGVFSIPGGTRALTADLCEARSVPLAQFSRDTITALEAVLPSFGVATNPTDVTGQVLSQPELFETALQIVARDPATTSLIVQLANRGPSDALRYKASFAARARDRAMPVVVSFLADAIAPRDVAAFARDGILCARDPADAVRYVDWLYAVARTAHRPAPRFTPPASRALGTLPTGWPGAMQLLAEAGIATPRWAIVPAGASPAAALDTLALPVAVKALPEQAEHKTEQRLLRLNLRTAEAVDDAVHALRATLGSSAPLLMQEMCAPGVECVLSAFRDRDFGVVVALGSGGVRVELMRDMGYLNPPIMADDVERIVERLLLGRMLEGFRGAAAADRPALVQSVLGLARAFAARSSELAEVEINPIIVLPRGQGVAAVDVLVKPADPTHQNTAAIRGRNEEMQCNA